MSRGLYVNNLMRPFSFILKLVSILFFSTFFQASNAENFDEVAVIPFYFETLYPIRREEIWVASCRSSLNNDQAAEWKRMLLKFAPVQSNLLQPNNIRVGLRVEAAEYYIDKDLVLVDASGKQYSPQGSAESAEIRDLAETYLAPCGKKKP